MIIASPLVNLNRLERKYCEEGRQAGDLVKRTIQRFMLLDPERKSFGQTPADQISGKTMRMKLKPW